MSAPARFEALGTQHVAALLAVLGASVLLPLAVNRLRSPRAASYVAAALGAALLASKAFEAFWYARLGLDWPQLLPLHLSDLVAFATAAALFSRHPFLYELAYFWGLGGALQALLTPDLEAGFPSASFWLFFVPHGLVVAGVFYATSTLRLRPRAGCIRRVYAALAAAAVPAALANAAFGTNYMYLRRKPMAASLLDFMGPWPWYILSMAAAGLLVLLLLYSPFWIQDRLSQGRNRSPSTQPNAGGSDERE
jgi:hypothetical integral membrane protein (TIGR02206 family)